MPSIANIWNKVRRSESILYAAFQIPASNVLDENKSIGKPILPRESYFEISLTEQFLKHKREYWNEYIPLTLFLTEFIYANERHELPFVVGPDLLKSIQQLEGTENVRYKNTRVVGPIPYRGDNVVLFAGLMRFKTKNWATQTIKLLESVAKSFDSSNLSGYLNIAEPMMEGIEGFFGMGDDMQFRMGQRDEFRQTDFVSGYRVMMREHQDNVKKEHLWVKDSELYYGKDKNNLQPYRENDYLLYEISASDKRNDYETFDFHKHWEKAREAVIQKNRQQAETEYQNLQIKLLNSKDIIEKQKNQLMNLYVNMFKELKTHFLKTPDFDDLFERAKVDESESTQPSPAAPASHITADAIKVDSGELAERFVIDQSFIEKVLNSPELNKPEILKLNN